MSSASEIAVEFDGVCKAYPHGLFGRGCRPALHGVSLRLEMGEAVGLVGPNRAGKTTLAKILLSLCRPDAGSARRFGRPLSDRATLARVGYVHESPAFPRYLTAAEILRFYGALALLPESIVDRRGPELLERVGLADRADEPIARFSKGMVQRLALAQALLNAPDLLVMDEPTEGLDAAGRDVFRDVIRDQRARGGAVLLITHLLGEVETLCDRVAVLADGRLVHVGPVDALTAGPHRTLEQAVAALTCRN